MVDPLCISFFPPTRLKAHFLTAHLYQKRSKFFPQAPYDEKGSLSNVEMFSHGRGSQPNVWPLIFARPALSMRKMEASTATESAGAFRIYRPGPGHQSRWRKNNLKNIIHAPIIEDKIKPISGVAHVDTASHGSHGCKKMLQWFRGEWRNYRKLLQKAYVSRFL